MHHIDVTPSAADVARPSGPSDVTVALETRAGCLGAYHRRPGRPSGLGYPVAPTATAMPGTHPGTAGRPSRAGNQIRVDPHHRPAGVDHRTHPLDPTLDTVPLAVSRPTTTPGPAMAQAPATAGTATITEALSTVGATTTQPPVTTPTTATAPPTTTAPTTTAPTTTAAPTTSLAAPTGTEPTSTEPTTGSAIP
jgi:hypothetical protein